jgi:hypothetical protein
VSQVIIVLLEPVDLVRRAFWVGSERRRFDFGDPAAE